MESIKQQRGITLIALIITIIVLLILAGVSISMVVGENRILNRAQEASEKTKFASEKEAIEFIMSDIKTGLMIKEEIPSEKYIGEKLSKMSSVTGNWKNVTVGEKIYDDGWYLLEEGKEIIGYGESKLNWLINYNTGELVKLEDGEYIIKNADASGAIVDDSLALNINPSNLQNAEEWGNDIQFYGGIVNENSGVKETEIKFDGVDDYLKINNVDILKSDGITYEFYGKSEDGNRINFLSKTFFNNDSFDLSEYSSFRNFLRSDGLHCRIGNGPANSELQGERK